MSSPEDFKVKYDLKKHICPFCDFRTHRKYNLDMHKSNKHRNEILHHPPKVEVEKYPLPIQIDEQPMDLDLLVDSIHVFKIFKLLQRMKNK